MKQCYSLGFALLATSLVLATSVVFTHTARAGLNAGAVAHMYWQVGTGTGAAGRTTSIGTPQLVVTATGLKSFRGADVQLYVGANAGGAIPGAWQGNGTGGCNDGNFNFYIGGRGGAYPNAFTTAPAVPGLQASQNQEIYGIDDCLVPAGKGLLWLSAAGAAGRARDPGVEYGLLAIRFDLRGTANGGAADCPGDLGDPGGPQAVSINAAQLFHCIAQPRPFTVAVSDSNGDIDYLALADSSGQLGWSGPAMTMDFMPPLVSILRPAAGENVPMDSTYYVATSASDPSGLSTMDADLSVDNGATFSIPVARGVPYTPALPWTVPEYLTSLASQAQLMVQVRDGAGNVTRDTSALFNIVDHSPPKVRMIFPNGGEVFTFDTTINVISTASDPSGVSMMRLDLSADGGKTWAVNYWGLTPYKGHFSWLASAPPGNNYRFRLMVYDANGDSASDESDSSWSIRPAPVYGITILAPNGGEHLAEGETDTIKVSLLLPARTTSLTSGFVDLSLDGGSTYTVPIATLPTLLTSIPWTVPNTATTKGRLRVSGVDELHHQYQDVSDSVFTIVDRTPPHVTLLSPNGGEALPGGASFLVRSSAQDNTGVTRMDLALSSDGGATFPTAVVTDVAYSDSLPVLVPNLVTTHGRMRITVRDAAGNAASAASAADFSVSPAESLWVELASLNGGQTVAAGDTVTLRLLLHGLTLPTTMDISFAANGTTFSTVVAAGIPYSPSYLWHVPNLVSSTCRLRVVVHDALNRTATGTSAGTFQVADQSPPQVALLSPNGGEVLPGGKSLLVRSSAQDNIGVARMDLALSTDGGATFPAVLASNVAYADSFQSQVPNTPTTHARLKITARDAAGNAASATSAADFTILQAESTWVELLSPNGGETLGAGDTATVRMLLHGLPQPTTMDLSLAADGVNYSTPVATGIAWSQNYSWHLPILTSSTCRLRVVVRDASNNTATGSSAGTFQIADLQPPVVSMVQPAGSGSLWEGGLATLRLSATDNVGVSRMDVLLSTDGGATFPQALATNIPYATSFQWTVPQAPTTHGRLQVTVRDAAGNPASDQSRADFSIAPGTGTSVTVTSPAGGEAWIFGSFHPITWTEVNPAAGSLADVAFSQNAGLSYDVPLASGLSDAGRFNWVAMGNTSYGRIRVSVTDPSGNTAVAQSNGVFQIFSPALPVLLSDLAGDASAASVTLRWTLGDPTGVASVKVDRREDPGAAFATRAPSLRPEQTMQWTDDGVIPGTAYVYRVTATRQDGTSDVRTLRVATPVAVFALHGAHPNPSRGALTLAYDLPQRAGVTLDVFDVRGVRIRSLVAGTQDAGTHQAAWDGLDSRGLRAEPGIYFLRLASGARTAVERAVILH